MQLFSPSLGPHAPMAILKLHKYIKEGWDMSYIKLVDDLML